MSEPERIAHDVARALLTVEVADAGLAQGSAGMAIAFDCFDRHWPDEGFAEAVRSSLFSAAQRFVLHPTGVGLYRGGSGVSWAIRRLPRHADDRLVAVADRIDLLLARRLEQQPWEGDYDLVSGLAGIGAYALEGRDTETGRDLLEAVIDHLAMLAVEVGPGVAWYTPPERLPAWQAAQAPNGLFNVGMAHGVPGVVALLGGAVEAGVAAEVARSLLEGAVAWILAQDDGERMPSWVALHKGPQPGRNLAWCYGDPGVAAALAVAARATGEERWQRKAVRLAVRSAEREPAGERIDDASLCHGAAGLAQVFSRLHEWTGEPRLEAAAREWVDRTLAMRDLHQKFAGYPFAGQNEDGTTSLSAAPGLLEGAAGVALSLLAADDPSAVSWDHFLLLIS